VSDTTLQLHDVRIDRGTTVLSVLVPKHEIAVLRVVHGRREVTDNGPAEDEEFELDGSAHAEIDRLTRVYHRVNSADPVRIAFPNGAEDLAKLGFSMGGAEREDAPMSGERKHPKPKKVAAKPEK